jgi:hypothetical protein
MKRKKELVKSKDLIFFDGKVLIQKDNTNWNFEIGKELTNDMAEAVSIMMRMDNIDKSIWDIRLNDLNIDEITPAKSLYWLTGGYEEWNNLENYNKPWSSCYLDFQEEFGFLVISIVKRSKKLSDIRDGFLKYLNLPTIYDYAIATGLIRTKK